MNTILRNFLNLFRRFKVATWLNIAGLMVAFAAFMVIMMQVKYEYDFDKMHPTSGRVFRADMPLDNAGIFSVIFPRPVAESIIHTSPHIEAGTVLVLLNETYFSVLLHGEKMGFKEKVIIGSPEVVKVFDFPILEGDRECLHDPEKVIIPRSLARKLFGNEACVGKSIKAEENLWVKSRNDFTIGAVYEDFATNTQLNNGIYIAVDADFGMDNWDASNFLCFLLLKDPADASQVAETFNNSFDFTKFGKDRQLELVPLESVYFRNERWDNTVFKSGSRETTYLFIGIAFLIVIIAAINYTNFSTSLTPMRIKSINTQKVLGSSAELLRGSLMVEAMLISLFSWLLGVGLVFILQQTNVFSFTEAGIDVAENSGLVLLTGGIALVSGLIAGIYPAWYMTSFPPALVLKGSFGLSPQGRQMRTVLIGFQFIVSMVLIIASLFVQLQRKMMQDFTTGFDKDQIAVVELNNSFTNTNRETLVSKLTAYPGIQDVAFATEKLGASDSYSTSTIEYNDMNIRYFLLGISPNFFSVMGIDIIEGRGPSVSDTYSQDPRILIGNRQLHDKYQLETGIYDFRFFTGNVVGFCGNVNFTSLRNETANYLFTPNYPYPLSVAYVRLNAGADYFGAVNHIRNSVAEVDPGFPVEIEFFDKLFERLYHKEESLNKMVTSFSILALIISIVGVFGLVLFEAQYRRKEIGVRKVMGAEIRDILFMFNRVYLHIVCICFLIAAPIAYYLIAGWLENFAYKTPIYWWVFVLAFILVALVTAITVSWQSWQSAGENPVNSIKSE